MEVLDLLEKDIFSQKERIFFRGFWLTRKQVQVLNLLVKGYTTDEVKEKLHITRNTLACHLNSIYRVFSDLKINTIQKLIVFYYRGYLKEDMLGGS